MDVLVPFDARTPKRRLAPELDARERRAFAGAMLADVLSALASTAAEPTVLATASVDSAVSVSVAVDERPLSRAVNARLEDHPGPLAVVMADLALATPAALTALFDREGDVVLAPGRGGGTNALLVRDPGAGFRVDYHGASIRDHREATARAGLDLAETDSFRLATDIDDPDDLVEVLLHGAGAAREWLVDAGYRVVTTDGRVRASRE